MTPPLVPRVLLFLDHAPALGGAEHSLLLLLKHLDRTRWQPHLISPGGPLAEQARVLGVPVHTVPMPRLRRSSRFLRDWLTSTRSIARLARQVSAALLHANTVRTAFYAAPAARLMNVPLVWHMRDFWLSESRPRWVWPDSLGKRLLGAAAVRVIANSQAVAASLPCSRRVTMIYNGIEVTRFNPTLDNTPFRQQHGIPSDIPVVGTIGRLRPWKGQERFLRAMARVAAAMPETWYLVVGGSIFDVTDDYLQRLQRVATDLGLAARTVFTGHLEDIRPALAAMDVFVHAGDPEPFGLVNIEAMAMAKPVVAFSHGALPEIVVDGDTGLLVPPGDEAALAEAAVALLRNPAWRALLGEKGRERVAQLFTAERMTANVSSVFAQVVR